MKLHLQSPAPMTQDEFNSWHELLVDALGSANELARMIGVTGMTMSRWSNGHAPTQWWYREVFSSLCSQAVDRYRHLIAETPSERKAQSYRFKINTINRRVEAIGFSGAYHVRQAITRGVAVKAAMAFLREHLPVDTWVPYADFIPAYRETGLSMKVLGRASEALGVHRRRNFGEGAHWRLPASAMIDSDAEDTDE